MNKKGVELPQNVIIIAIIILVVLVVLIAFFVGGAGKTFGKFSDLFGKSVDDESTAISFCQQYCQAAQDQPRESQARSNYCTKWFKLDRLPKDGKTDTSGDGKTSLRYYCSTEHELDTAGVTSDTTGVGISCPDVTC